MTEQHTTRVLIIVTTHADLGDTGRATGLWFEELTTPYYLFIDGGAEVTIASLTGGKVPLDPHSTDAGGKNLASVGRFMTDGLAMQQLEHSKKIDEVRVEDYDAVFLPGGHGAMWDLASSEALGALLTTAWSEGKIVAAVCHGPAGLVNTKDTSGKPLVAQRRVSAFTNAEEAAAGLTKVVPFLLETKLRELGAAFEPGPDFQPQAVRDGNLVTGQNPASSERVAELIFEALRDMKQ